MKRQQPGFWPLYPFAVAALPVVHFYPGSFRLFEPGDGARILLACPTVTVLALALGRMVWRDTNRAALVITPVLLVFFKGSALGAFACVALLLVAVALGVLLRVRPEQQAFSLFRSV